MMGLNASACPKRDAGMNMSLFVTVFILSCVSMLRSIDPRGEMSKLGMTSYLSCLYSSPGNLRWT